ncbi:fungal specific transcription factor domain-containing protein [Cladophialophora carrionii]|uniref:Fungal specific transcription factor domain-containing protein n=1 Tax=Cladophialophora carrionii TaxID=86049 RepID=A0A1C1CH74_9EURO|nr:fungal specific transcription factor domain-containing protein [Cladophialophora carrionii]
MPTLWTSWPRYLLVHHILSEEERFLTRVKYSDQEEDEPEAGSSSQSQSHTEPSIIQQTSSTRGPARAGTASGENKAGSSVGSPGRQGELPRVVSLNSGGGASGFVGKMSEISWIQRAFETVRGYRDDNPGRVHAAEMDVNIATTTDFIYFMDDTNVLAVDEDYVDPYHWPAKESVVLLSEAFFHAMQGTFHFVLREQFLQQAYQFSATGQNLSWSKRRWLALANLVWAIGSKWLQITKLDESSSNEDHLIYYARARALGLDHRVLFDHPDIERVQGIGLLAFYLLINGSITRAWNTLGTGTRHATALGLHLKVTDESVSQLEKARRARTWYSLYSLEILIAEMTGRPKSIFLVDVTIPIDLFWSAPQEIVGFSGQVDGFLSPDGSRKIWLEYLHACRNISQMTGGIVPWKSFASLGHEVPTSYLPQRLYLCRLSDRVASQMYSGTSEDSWSEIQNKIGTLQSELREWAENLPQELAIQGHKHVDTDPRTKIELGMYYHSIAMILNRPCLCEINIKDESAHSQEFNRSAARACVHAAMSMLALMPDYPTAHEANQLLPWWSLLHFVAQATAVLMLELALDAQHCRDEIPQLATYLRKAMGYLWCLTEGSLSAYRAWRIFRQLLTEVSQRYEDLDLTDIPTDAQPPPTWNEEYEEATRNAFSNSRRKEYPFPTES